MHNFFRKLYAYNIPTTQAYFRIFIFILYFIYIYNVFYFM